jgi:hypothetical protein
MVINQSECPNGGEHEFEPIWVWSIVLDDYDFVDQRCGKCGEIK